jgi:hypothetical protein
MILGTRKLSAVHVAWAFSVGKTQEFAPALGCHGEPCCKRSGAEAHCWEMSANRKRAYTTEHASLEAAERVLEAFRQEMKRGGTLSAPSIQARLALYRSNDDWTAVCTRAATVIEGMKKARVARFDPFILCGTNPLEPPLNRVLARIFDPQEVHGLGLAPITGLLSAVKEQAPEIVGAILQAIKRSPHVRVKPNFRHPRWGIVDIALVVRSLSFLLRTRDVGMGRQRLSPACKLSGIVSFSTRRRILVACNIPLEYS